MLQELQRGDPRFIGPYQLVGNLGGGGMGRVFLGRSAGGRLVAVKVIRSDLAADPDFRARFRREVAAARRVSGLYTAMVVDADADAEEPWLATAYVAGPSLAEAVHDHGPLPAKSTLALAAGLAESLDAIHKVGVVHRDLKPSNVLLAEDGPRLIDFGISRAAESTSVTRAGFVIGSPGFMSPEQAQGSEVGPPSDIFSLGAVLVFAVTGEAPFGGGSTAALVFRVVFSEPNLETVPGTIRPLVQRCLAKDPSQRPSASKLLTEIGAMQPEVGWLPDPVTSAFPKSQAQVVTAPPPSVVEAAAAVGAVGAAEAVGAVEVVAAVGAAEVVGTREPPAAPPETSPTITGFAPHVAAEPAAVTREPEIAPPQPVAEMAPPLAGSVPPAPATAPPAAGTAPPAARTVPPAPATVPPVSGTGRPQAETVGPEPETDPTRLRSPGPGAEPATGPEVWGAEPGGPGGGGLPLPWGDLQGPRRPRSRRPLVLAAVAAAVILIGAGGAALALSGSGHPSAAASHTPPTVVVTTPAATTATTAAQSPTPQPSPTAAPTSHHPTPSPSRHPTTQPAAQPTQAHTTAPPPAPTTSRPAPRPSTPKPTHTAPPPTTYSFSVSGASEESCGIVGSVQSVVGSGVSFNIVNNSSGTVVIDEIGSNGSLYNDATLSPGLEYSGSAYVGLYYVVYKSGGGCLAVFHLTGSGHLTIN